MSSCEQPIQGGVHEKSPQSTLSLVEDVRCPPSADVPLVTERDEREMSFSTSYTGKYMWRKRGDTNLIVVVNYVGACAAKLVVDILQLAVVAIASECRWCRWRLRCPCLLKLALHVFVVLPQRVNLRLAGDVDRQRGERVYQLTTTKRRLPPPHLLQGSPALVMPPRHWLTHSSALDPGAASAAVMKKIG